MIGFLTFCVVAFLAFAALGVFALPFLLIGGLIWLILLPIKLVFGLFGLFIGGIFRLVFGVLGALLGLILAPIALVIGGVLLVAGLIAGIVMLLTPLVPVALVLLLGWAIYEGLRPKGEGRRAASGLRPSS